MKYHVCTVLIFILLLSLTACSLGDPKNKQAKLDYIQANQLFQEKKYEEADVLFKSSGSYKDAEVFRFKIAKILYSNKEIEKSFAILRELANVEGAIVTNTSDWDILNKKAKDYSEPSKIPEAASAFLTIKGNEISKEASSLEQNSKFTKAAEKWILIGQDEYAEQCMIYQAYKLFSDGLYQEAVEHTDSIVYLLSPEESDNLMWLYDFAVKKLAIDALIQKGEYGDAYQAIRNFDYENYWFSNNSYQGLRTSFYIDGMWLIASLYDSYCESAYGAARQLFLNGAFKESLLLHEEAMLSTDGSGNEMGKLYISYTDKIIRDCISASETTGVNPDAKSFRISFADIDSILEAMSLKFPAFWFCAPGEDAGYEISISATYNQTGIYEFITGMGGSTAYSVTYHTTFTRVGSREVLFDDIFISDPPEYIKLGTGDAFGYPPHYVAHLFELLCASDFAS